MQKSLKPEQHVLSNGIPVILQHYEGGVAATYWWIQTGSADEVGAEAGFAHFLEHMLFKDAAAKETGRASTGQMARAIESLGGEINAYTSFDQTVYHVTCAAQHWEKVLDAFGGMAKPQKFLKSDFDREREVILEELRKNEDSPSRQLFQSLFSSTFAKHPYGRPVIGFTKTLKAAKVAQLESFYRNHYVSERMGLILVGPVAGDENRKKTLLKLLEKRYGSAVIPKKAARHRDRPEEPDFRNQTTYVKRAFDVKTPTLAFSFRAPDLMHSDVPALDLCTSILAMGELSRLYQNLFYKTSLATDVSGGLYVPRDPGMLYFQAETESVERIPEVARAMLGELEKIKREGPTEAELKRVLVNAESERLYATQSADGMASRLGFLRFVLGDLHFDKDYLDALRAVDADKIREVADRYFDPKRMSVALLLPKDQGSFDIKKVQEAVESVLRPASAAAPVKGTKKSAPAKKAGKSPAASIRPEMIKRPSGLTIAYRENPQSHVMSIHGVTLGGLRLEIANPIERADTDWGSSYLMSLTWSKGTQGKNAHDIASIVEGSAAGLDGFSGRNTVGLQMTGLARDWRKLSSLFSEVLVEPSFPESEVDHSRRVAEDAVRGIEDHTSQLCSKLFLETLFENHPYGRLTTGSLESLKAIRSEKLRRFHQLWLQPERLVVSVSGAVPRKELELFIDELDSRLASKSGKRGGSFPDRLPEEEFLKAPRWVEKHMGREQQHIIVGSYGTRIDSQDRRAIQILQTLLGGQSGRLFIELREKKSLAYTVAPVSFDGIERGYIGTYIACSPSKREEALVGIRKVLEELVAKGPKAAEMSRAKEFYLGRRAMDLQSDSSIATHFGLETVYGLPYRDDAQVLKEVSAIGPKEIQRVCEKYLVEPHMVTSVVG